MGGVGWMRMVGWSTKTLRARSGCCSPLRPATVDSPKPAAALLAAAAPVDDTCAHVLSS